MTFKFLLLEYDTRGAAETLNISLKKLELEDQPIISLDSDNFYTTDIINLWDQNKNSIYVFNDTNVQPAYSYILINDRKEVTKIVEKTKISDYACCGGYAFKSYKELQKYTQYIIDNDIKQKDEFYTSTVVMEMLKNKSIFHAIEIPNDKYVCLGTPLQLRHFYNNFPYKSCKDLSIKIKNMRICFDLDNTLVSFPKMNGDYSTVEPIKQNIDYLKYLKSFGNTIIIYTARRMKTHHGNTGKVMADIGKITFDTLEKYSIPYDEIYFGKPQADVYIDDLGLNCFDDLEKELGFYMDKIEPREFNHLDSTTIELYTKKSKDLSGEIYYYKHIPFTIKDIFPLFVNYDVNNSWYTIEKIDGLTMSVLYTSEMLNEITLTSILDTVKRIQSCEHHDEQINIYENYSNKLTERYETFDYSSFPNHEQLFNDINCFLKNYEKYKKGKMTIIHGDPVFTNIIINKYNKIKFIDMRGKWVQNLQFMEIGCMIGQSCISLYLVTIIFY